MIENEKKTTTSQRRRVYHASPQRAPSSVNKKADGHIKTSVHRKRSNALNASKKQTSRKSSRSYSGNTSNRSRARNVSTKKKNARITDHIPRAGDKVRIIPLGGVEEVGKNMIAVEYKDDILIFDVGFQFEEETTPGIDYILPNTRYLEERKDKIRGVIITHGHLDHIGGIPYILPRIGNPTIYTRQLTSFMILKRQEEFKHLPTPNIKIVEPGEKITLGNLPIEFFPVTHSIPDSMGISIKTPYGNVVISGDLRLDHVKGEPTDAEKKTWGEVGKQNNLLFISDSTNAQNLGFSLPESEIVKNLETVISKISGRIIVGTFASQFARMIKLLQIAEKFNRKVIVDGRSMKTNIEIAEKAGLLKIKKGTIIDVKDADSYPPHKLFILATGAQGEEFAALMRIANKTHKFLRFTPKDTIILSSSIIPGNEMSVQKLKDNLYRHAVRIVHYRVSDIHASGHGNIEELKWIHGQVGAKYFMPGYGYHSMLRVHAQEIENKGFPKENIIIPDNGMIIDLDENGFKILKEKAPSNIVMVDGFSIGDMQEVVLRDRQMLAQDGILMVVALIDLNTGTLRKSPDIISRGFVYLRESQDLLGETRKVVRKTVEDTLVGMHPINFDYVKGKLTDNVARFLAQKTAKRPIVIPVLLGV